MAHQSDLHPPNPRDPQARSRPASSGASPHPIHWMARVEVLIRVVVRLYLGLLVLVLPWLPFWTQNNLFTYGQFLLTISENGFVRGVVSGIGLLNIIIAVLDAKYAKEFS